MNGMKLLRQYKNYTIEELDKAIEHIGREIDVVIDTMQYIINKNTSHGDMQYEYYANQLSVYYQAIEICQTLQEVRRQERDRD